MDLIHRIKMKFKKPKMVETLEIIEGSCVGCGRCVEMCKMKVFAVSGRKVVVANRSSCVGCGKCVEKMCNFGAIKLVIRD